MFKHGLNIFYGAGWRLSGPIGPTGDRVKSAGLGKFGFGVFFLCDLFSFLLLNVYRQIFRDSSFGAVEFIPKVAGMGAVLVFEGAFVAACFAGGVTVVFVIEGTDVVGLEALGGYFVECAELMD